MRLLIVEDDKIIRSSLVAGFKKLKYSCDCACDGEEALDCYYQATYDAIVLDLNLPKIDGLDILLEIRKENLEIPVLILSARSEVEDIIKGLNIGANDYLSKPFHFLELEARIRALTTRKFITAASTIALKNGIIVDLTKKMCFKNASELILTSKEYGILEYLSLHAGSPISTEELLEHIGDINTNELSSSIKVHISSLRKKLPEDTIKTLRGIGYYVE